MAEGHIQFTLSVRTCVYICVCSPESRRINNLAIHDGIWNSFSTNDHQDKTMCRKQEPFRKVKG